MFLTGERGYVELAGSAGGREGKRLTFKECEETGRELADISSPAFPDNKNPPAGGSQLFEIAFVAFDVTLAFFLPELCMRGRLDPAVAAAMHVPETTMNEDDLFVPYEYKVGIAR